MANANAQTHDIDLASPKQLMPVPIRSTAAGM